MLPYSAVQEPAMLMQHLHHSPYGSLPLQPLDNNNTVVEFRHEDVNPEDLLGEPDKMVELKILVASGSTVATVKASLATRVIELKREIARQEGTPAWKQQLLHGSQLLEDLKPLGRYSSFSESDEDMNLMLVRSAPFIPAYRATEFLELPELNYIFRDGEQGLGYYVDENQGHWASLPVWRN